MKKLTLEQKKANKEKKLGDKYEKEYGEIGRKIEKTIKDVLAKHDWVAFSEVYDELWQPIPGQFNVTTQFVPKKIADKIVKDRLKHINDMSKMSKVV
jgi:hypothetical protein